tara:strand:+ start:237 stop:353 length:117 start_codon:yes stop_codon:yes gene_type:complete
MEINNMIEKITKKWNAWSTTKKSAVVAGAVVLVILLII